MGRELGLLGFRVQGSGFRAPISCQQERGSALMHPQHDGLGFGVLSFEQKPRNQDLTQLLEKLKQQSSA